MVSLSSALAQEVARPSLARQQARSEAPVGNIKVGPIVFSANAGLTTEFVDNIDLSADDPVADLIITPEVGLAAIWRLTPLNTIRFQTTIGYSKYLEKSDLDRQRIIVSPDSALTFTLHAGDFRIVLKDQFTIQNETVDEGSLSGVASLPRLENTAGISILWDANDLRLSAGYDHFDFITLGSAASSGGVVANDLSRLDHSTEQVFIAGHWDIRDGFELGLEATGAYSYYPDQPSADFYSATLGPTLEWQISRYLGVQMSGGIKGYKFADIEPTQQTAIVFVPTGLLIVETETPAEEGPTETGYYARFNISHRLNRYYAHALDFGHEDSADALSGRTAINFARYTSTWQIGSEITLSSGLFWEDVEQEQSSAFSAATSQSYRRMGGQIATSYKLTQRVSLSGSYQFLVKQSDVSELDYVQNRVALGLQYRF